MGWLSTSADVVGLGGVPIAIVQATRAWSKAKAVEVALRSADESYQRYRLDGLAHELRHSIDQFALALEVGSNERALVYCSIWGDRMSQLMGVTILREALNREERNSIARARVAVRETITQLATGRGVDQSLITPKMLFATDTAVQHASRLGLDLKASA